MHGRGFARGCDGSEVRIDVVLAKGPRGAKMCEGMCKGVRSGRSDLRVTAGGGQAELRQLWLVIAVDEVVRTPG